MSTTRKPAPAAAAAHRQVHSTADLYGNKLVALDGDIGHVKDFYFDDETRVIGYLFGTEKIQNACWPQRTAAKG